MPLTNPIAHHRPADKIALSEIAFQLAHQVPVILGLDTLRDRLPREAANFSLANANPALSATYTRVDLGTVGPLTAAGLRLVKAVHQSSAFPCATLTYTTTTYTNVSYRPLANIGSPRRLKFCQLQQPPLNITHALGLDGHEPRLH